VVQWKTITPRGEVPDGRAAAHLFPFEDNKLVLLGGYNPIHIFQDVHVLDTDTMFWTKIEPKGPTPCLRDASASIYKDTLIIIFGGRHGIKCLNFVYVLHLGTWTWENITNQIEGEPPYPRMSHGSAVIGDRMYIFGGITSDKKLLSDIHIFDIRKLRWISPQVCGRPPTARQNMTITPIDKRLLVFGGWDGRRQHNDVHVFDTERLGWYKPHVCGTVPRPRNHHTAVSLTVGRKQQLFVFAGWNGRAYMDDLDCLDLQVEEYEESLLACNQPDFHDFTILIEGKSIYVHKVILAARSVYFRSLLTQDFLAVEDGDSTGIAPKAERGTWQKKSEIVLNGVGYDIFLAFVQFLYTDVADATTEMIGPLLALTEKYGVEHIDRMSEYLILTRLKTPMSLNKNLRWAFNNPLFSDICFVVKDKSGFNEEHEKGKQKEDHEAHCKRIYGHKVIVCGRSPYLKALLLGGLKEATQKEIIINADEGDQETSAMLIDGDDKAKGQVKAVDAVTSSEIRYEVFFALMKYLYTMEMELENDEDRLDLLVLANLYSVDSLKKLVEDDLIQSLDFENVSCLFALADTASALNLRRACLEFMTENENMLAGVKLTWSYSDLISGLKKEIETFWISKQAREKKREKQQSTHKRLLARGPDETFDEADPNTNEGDPNAAGENEGGPNVTGENEGDANEEDEGGPNANGDDDGRDENNQGKLRCSQQ
jgi:N-acetylneuraminic acid mutarotase